MIKLTLDSAKGKQIAYRASWIRGYSLYDVYKRPSEAKMKAYQYCLETMESYKGEKARITGFNCYFFSFAFNYTDGSGIEHVIYITPTEDYDVTMIETKGASAMVSTSDSDSEDVGSNPTHPAI